VKPFAALALLALAATAAAPARAGSILRTPPVLAATADVDCMVLQSVDENSSAIARLRNGTGTVVDGGTPYPVYLGVNTAAAANNVTGYFYCEFEGLAKTMRGYISLEDAGQTVLMLPAAR
jgi:hypothetical protein